MKKIILFANLMFILSFAVFSQNLSLKYNGAAVANNSLIQVSGPCTSALSVILHVKNNTSGTLNVKAKKVVIDTVPFTTNSICFAGNCFGPETYTAPTIATIDAGGTDSSFAGDYVPAGNPGMTTVLYVFFNTANPQDTVCVRVQFNGLAGINEIKRSDIIFHDAYPNPSNNVTTFSFSLPKQTNSASIIVRNLLGSEVMNVQLEDLYGKKTINTSDLKEGIYFYSLRVNDKIYYTRKLVVKH